MVFYNEVWCISFRFWHSEDSVPVSMKDSVSTLTELSTSNQDDNCCT